MQPSITAKLYWKNFLFCLFQYVQEVFNYLRNDFISVFLPDKVL